MYEDPPINKVNFAKAVSNRNHCLQLHLIFSKEINSDGFFHVPEDSKYDLLYRPLHLELFLWRVSMFPLHRLSF